MTELSVHLPDMNVHTSVYFEGGGEIALACTASDSADSENEDADVDAGDSGCGCGENQLSHHDELGQVREDLNDRCRRAVDGPIGAAAGTAVTAAAIAIINQEADALLRNPGSDTEPETDLTNSMQVECTQGSASDEVPPPPNQEQHPEITTETVRVNMTDSCRRELVRRVDDWNRKVAAVKNSQKSARKRTILVRVLGDSRHINVKISSRKNY